MMRQKYKYWIPTLGNKALVFSLLTKVPDNTLTIMYGLKQCNWFTYFLFKKTKINLLVKDKLRWRKH